MKLFGDNTMYGQERVELGELRVVEPVVQDEPEFPLGVGGLVPVVTERKKKGPRTVWAFKLRGGVGPEAEASEQEPMFAVVRDACDLVNRMLDLAVKQARYNFGVVNGVWIGVGEEGYGFTRVEVVEKDAHGEPSPAPLHLHIETSDIPGEPFSLSAVVEYTREGKVFRAVITEFGDYGDTCRVLATVNAKSGKLSVAKVEQFRGGERDGRLLYKRGWEPENPDRSSSRARGWGDGGFAEKRTSSRQDGPRGGRLGGSGRDGRDGWRGDRSRPERW